MKYLLGLLLTMLISCSSRLDSDVYLYGNSKIYKPLIMSSKSILHHPRIHAQFLKALNTWEQVAPVQFHLIIGNAGPRNAVVVEYTYPIDAWGVPQIGVIGLYNSRIPVLYIADFMEEQPDKYSDLEIYKTCLHELGHLLGIPHVIGKYDSNDKPNFINGTGFDIVLPTIEEAKECIMYPTISPGSASDLTELEIAWAHHFLMHDLNLSYLSLTCEYYER